MEWKGRIRSAGVALLTLFLLLTVAGCTLPWQTEGSSFVSLPEGDGNTVSASEEGDADSAAASTTRRRQTTVKKKTTAVSAPKKTTTRQRATTTRREETASDYEYTAVKVTKCTAYTNPYVVPDFSYEHYWDSTAGVDLPYRLYVPTGTTGKRPILVFLHGLDAVGADNQKHVWGITKAFPVAGDIVRDAIVVLPQTPSGWSVNGSTGILDVVKRLVDSLVSTYNGDRARLYVTGQSLGGFATWNIVDAYPGYFAAAVPLCGGVGPRVSEGLLNTPIWTFHGKADNIVSITGTEQTYQAIRQAGGQLIKFTRLYDVQHNAWDYAYTDREMFSWMFSQVRGSHQSLQYTYRHYFQILSPKNEVLVTEEDLEVFYKEYYGLISYTLNDKAIQRLRRAYTAAPKGTFCVKVGGEKLYDYRYENFTEENNFWIEQTIDDEAYTALFNMINQNRNQVLENESVYEYD